MIPALFCKTAACLDPFVYAITNQKFREELDNIFPILKTRKKRRSKPKKQPNKDDVSIEMKRDETSAGGYQRAESVDGVEEVSE